MPMRVPGERKPPLYFAGRRAELRKFNMDLQELCETNEAGGLQLTVGVPGSGKTQLGLEFARHAKNANIGGREIFTMAITPESLDDPVSLFLRMGTEIGAGRQASEIAQVDDKVASVSGGALTAKASVTRDIGRHTASFPALLDESKRQGMWDGKALVLLIDELQGVSNQGMKPLSVIHAGLHGCPILAMGFGLQHTAMRLANRSEEPIISRIAERLVLAPLDRADTIDAFSSNLSMLGHDDIPRESLEALADASYGFPQHINGYLEGAHESLTKHHHLAGQSLEQALHHGHQRRVKYYEGRLANRAAHKPMRAIMAAMERNNAASLDYHDAKQVLIDAGFDEVDLDNAIAHGSLTLARGEVSFGIPSFHSYMAHLLAKVQNAEHGRNS